MDHELDFVPVVIHCAMSLDSCKSFHNHNTGHSKCQNVLEISVSVPYLRALYDVKLAYFQTAHRIERARISLLQTHLHDQWLKIDGKAISRCSPPLSVESVCCEK